MIKATEAIKKMEEARQKFVAAQYDEIERAISEEVTKVCEEYRKTGSSKGIRVRIDKKSLAPENRRRLEEAGYQLSDGNEGVGVYERECIFLVANLKEDDE